MRKESKYEWKGALKAIFVIAVMLGAIGIGVALWDDTKSTGDTLTASEWNAMVADQKNRTNTATLVVAASDSSSQSKAAANYVCDGIDDQVEIQWAINNLSSNGGTVYIAEGTYLVTTTISVDSSSNITIKGSGSATILRPQTEDIATFEITNSSYITIKDLVINQLDVWRDTTDTEIGNLNAGVTIRNSSDHIYIDNVEVKGRKFGVATFDLSTKTIDETCSWIGISNCRFLRKDSNDLTTGFLIHAHNSYVINSYIESCTTDRTYSKEIIPESANIAGQHLRVLGNYFYGSRHNSLTLWYGDIDKEDVVIANNIFQRAREDAIDSLGVKRAIIANNVFYDIVQHAFSDDNGAQLVSVIGNVIEYGYHDYARLAKFELGSGIVIANNLCKCGAGSVQLYGCNDVTIQGNRFYVYLSHAANNYNVYLGTKNSTVCENIEIKDNYICNGVTAKWLIYLNGAKNISIHDNYLKRGKVEEVGDADYNVFKDNKFESVTVTLIGANDTVKANIGYTTENSGVATISNGSSSVVVNHGLAKAPEHGVRLTGTHSEVANCWVTNVTDTQFTINAPSAVTADRYVFWEAEV